MIRHEVIQNTPDWLRLRLGIPTASEFHRIITPKGKLAKNDTSRAYMSRLLAEWILGCPIDDGAETDWMQRGHDLEPQAMKAFAFERDVDPIAGGFFTTDDGLIGASPDFEVGDRELLELKCPSPQVHVGYLRDRAIDEKYKPQVQGQLSVCEKDIDHLQSYHPQFPTVIISHGRDEAYIKDLDAALRQFTDEMLAAREMLTREYGPFRRIGERRKPADEGRADWITDEDLQAALRNVNA